MNFIEDPEIQLVIEEKFFLDGVGFFQNVDFYSWIFSGKSTHDLGNHAGATHQREGDIQLAFIIFSQILQFFFPVLTDLEDFFCIFHIFAACVSWRVAVSAAAEQFSTHFPFQFLKMFGQGWLGNIKFLGCFC